MFDDRGGHTAQRGLGEPAVGLEQGDRGGLGHRFGYGIYSPFAAVTTDGFDGASDKVPSSGWEGSGLGIQQGQGLTVWVDGVPRVA